MLDLVFMGTAPFAVPCLQALAGEGHRIAAVVSQPDRPHGRGLRLQSSPVKLAALELGLPVLQPEKASLAEFVEQLRSLAPQIIVVVAYGQILRASVLEIPPLGCINVHGSLLPELRGAAPIQWSVIRGCAETGVTTMFMDAGMDTGDMILKAALPISSEDTAGTLAERLAPVGAELLVRTVTAIEAAEAPRQAQDNTRATYAPMLRKEDGALFWTESAIDLRNRIHGCNPAPGAFMRRADGAVVKVWRAAEHPYSGDAAPGTVVDAERLLVATGRGALQLLEVQPESRGRLSADTYVRGYPVTSGEVWRDGYDK